MNVNIINKNFNGISTAVFYKFSKYVPTNYTLGQDILEIVEKVYDENGQARYKRKYITDNGNLDFERFWGNSNEDSKPIWDMYKGDGVQYYGTNDTILEGQTIIEYNFSRTVEKLKFNDTFPLSLLDVQSKDLIGKNIGGIELVRNVFFPTNVIKGDEKDYSYFGSISISPTLDQYIYVLDLGESYWKIELYGDVVSENLIGSGEFYDYDFLKMAVGDNEIVAPDIVITLGPNQDNSVLLEDNTTIYRPNPINMYFGSEDSIVDISDYGDNIITFKEWKELYSEIHDKKVLYLLFSPDPDIGTFNLFASLAPHDKNLNRNMKETSLRNDEFYSYRGGVGVIEKETGSLLLDKNSDTLLGIREIHQTPILQRKIRKVRKRLGLDNEIPNYSHYVRYKQGAKVMYSGDTWVSLVDDNIGNSPKISNTWSIWTERGATLPKVIVKVVPEQAANITPNGIIRVGGDSGFDFIYEVAENYRWRDTDPITDGTNPIDQSCYEINDGICHINKFLYENYLGEYTGPEATGYIIFQFEKIRIPISIQAMDERSNISDYNNWRMEDYKLICTGIIAEDGGTEEELEIQDDGTIMLPVDCDITFGFMTSNAAPYKVSGIMIGDNIFDANISDYDQRVCSVTINRRFTQKEFSGQKLMVLIDRIRHNVSVRTGDGCSGNIIFDKLIMSVEDNDTYNNRFYLSGDSISNYNFNVFQINHYGNEATPLEGGYSVSIGQEDIGCRYFNLELTSIDPGTGDPSPMKIKSNYLIEVTKNEN